MGKCSIERLLSKEWFEKSKLKRNGFKKIE
jgi:hypothetical protein